MLQFGLVLLAALLTTGCKEKSRPWERTGEDAAPPWPVATTSSKPLLSPTFVQAAGLAPSGESGGVSPAEPSLPLPVRVGGPWVRCYGDFRLEGPLLGDLMRLTMLCGPANGMHRVSKKPVEGEVVEGGNPVTMPLEAKRGSCYRIFAVAEESVTDLDVVVRSSRGVAIAQDHGEDRWPIVQPDRPFCPLENDTMTIELTARHGKGRAAAEVWMLRAALTD